MNPPSSDTPLFPPELISPAVTAALPTGYTIRPLRKGDYSKGFLDVLQVLTTVGDIDQQAFEERYEEMSRRNDAYYILCILDGEEDVGKIVGTGALVVERKL